MKTVFIINGKGACGKDTLVKAVAAKYPTQNESAIDPVKAAGRLLGYEGGKSDKDREFLSKMKELSIWYNDHPTQYLLQKYREFEESNNELLFLHIREPEQIKHFLECFEEAKNPDTRIATVLIKSEWTQDHTYGNPSDDNVDKMHYDLIYINKEGEETSGFVFLNALENFIAKLHHWTV